jgi:hypothetical protein
MMSNSVQGAKYKDFLAPIWTQSSLNSDSPGNGSPNVLVYSEATQQFEGVADLDTEMPVGQGFLVYIFNDDQYGVDQPNAFPKLLSVNGTEVASGSINLTRTESGLQANRGFNLVGNPFASPFNAYNWANGNADIANVVYVYDATYSSPGAGDFANPNPQSGNNPGGAYRAFNGSSGSLSNGIVAPNQGFWVQANQSASGVSIANTFKENSGPRFYREANTSASVQLRAVSGNMISDAWISLTSDGSVDLDSRDAFKLAPLDLRPYMSLATSAEGRMLDINNLPADLTSITELPLHVELFDVQSNAWTPSSGNVTLTWPEIRNFPSDWVLELVDARTGATVNMLSETSFEFEVQPALRKSAPREPRMTPSVQSADGSTALFLRVGPATSTSVQTGGVDVPLVTELYGNYPNPFNPTTRIQYALPFASHVRLEVFDLMGRRVALLVDGEQRAGSQFVNFDASSLSSGVYVYRLTAAGQTLTRKMTLVK